jgi:hypothetical protein
MSGELSAVIMRNSRGSVLQRTINHLEAKGVGDICWQRKRPARMSGAPIGPRPFIS